MSQPIILCGLGRTGARVLEYLQAAHLTVVVVDTACRPDDARLHGARLVNGDCRRRDVLEAAGVHEASGVLLLTGDDLLNINATLLVRTMNPNVRIVLRMFNQSLIGRLGKALTNVFALSTSLLTAPILAMTALTGQALGTFRVEGLAEGRRQVAELVVGPQSPLRGQTVIEVTGWREMQVLAHLPEGAEARFLLAVDPEARLEAGDKLVVCGEPRSVAGLLAGGADDSPGLRWAGKLRRYGRVLGRTLGGIEKPVAWCTLVLVGVVLISSVVLHVGVEKYTYAQALQRTISIMATGSSMHEEELQSDAMLVYASILRIMGAALMAAFTAIVTNYLIRARLAGALEAGRIPESGHVVVCGLTPVGFRVVEEVLAMGEQVVVLELDPANRFVSTVRRLKAAVIVGDATIAEVQRQARAASARAVVAATHDDMVNLEIALLVRESNPAQRVVLLQGEPNLAEMLRREADIRYAVSVPALAAPAFLAGLFGGRVLSVFLVHDRLLAVLNLDIQVNDPFVGQAVRAIAVDYRLTPVAVVPAAGPPPRQPLNARIGAGDRLAAIVALTDLERLLRREPAATTFAVDVLAVPLPARGWLAGLLRTIRGGTQEETEAALQQLPLRAGTSLTRGQAEDLLAQLVRERVTAKLVQADSQMT